MAGYDLNEGKLCDSNVSEDQLWSLFNYVFVGGSKKTSSYKFGFLKAILDNLFNGIWCEDLYELSYDTLFAKFAENYWNIIVKYNLKQQKQTEKTGTSRIETIFNDVLKINGVLSNLEFTSIEYELRLKTISLVEKTCRKYVVGALYKDLDGHVYSFNKKEKNIKISRQAYDFLFKYKMELEKLNYYAWAKFLESINDDTVLIRVLDKLELSTPHRTDLSVYREILKREFEDNNCFYCGTKLEGIIEVDHFIPWSFVKDDKAWNFVLSCSRCNRQKKDLLVSGDYMVRIIKRNNVLKDSTNITVRKDFIGYNSELLRKMYLYAKISGLKEINWK